MTKRPAEAAWPPIAGPTIPASRKQIEHLRELGEFPEIGAEGKAFIEAEIAKGLTADEAYKLIQRIGGRIQEIREAKENG